MRAYYLFLKENISGVTFGWLLTFFSSFGQTFLISLYVPDILKSFHLTNSSFGLIYAICTIISSAILLITGYSIDHNPVRKITYFTLLGLAASCLLAGFATHPVLLIIAMIGLRLTGQGLMSHISLTVMSRYYDAGRGKALSLSSLGYSAGEAVFPIVITFLILQFGWRFSIIASAIMIIIVLFPILVKTNLEEYDEPQHANRKISQKLLWNDYFIIMKGKNFWRIAPSIFTLSFIITGIFFYQFVIAEKAGWAAELYAVGFTGYAVTRFLFSLVGGTWVDKYGAGKLFPYFLLPMSLGFLFLLFIPHISGAFLFLFLTGITVGISGPVKAAILAEDYGTEKIGAIRSLFTMVMIISTAVGPLVLGLLLDASLSINSIFVCMLILLCVSSFSAFGLNKFVAKKSNDYE